VFLHQVSPNDSIFFAIEQNYVEGVKKILDKHRCSELTVSNNHPYFQFAHTPLSMAASNNNYEILRLLKKYHHRLKVMITFPI